MVVEWNLGAHCLVYFAVYVAAQEVTRYMRWVCWFYTFLSSSSNSLNTLISVSSSWKSIIWFNFSWFVGLQNLKRSSLAPLIDKILILLLFTADECFDGIHECDSLAKCHNTAGNYTCQCPDGFYSEWKDCIGNEKHN